MSEETVTDISHFEAPYGRRILLQNVSHESGLKLLRVRLREGSRFTILEIDAPTARLWGEAMLRWAETADSCGAPSPGAT
jgi:hypothetical protein